MAATIRWWTNWQEAQAAAKKAVRPLMLEFFLDGCPHCARLDRETFQDPAVIETLNESFIPVRLEARAHLDLAREFGVRHTPTMLLFSPEGQEKHRFDGFLSAPELLQQLSVGAQK